MIFDNICVIVFYFSLKIFKYAFPVLIFLFPAKPLLSGIFLAPYVFSGTFWPFFWPLLAFLALSGIFIFRRDEFSLFTDLDLFTGLRSTIYFVIYLR